MIPKLFVRNGDLSHNIQQMNWVEKKIYSLRFEVLQRLHPITEMLGQNLCPAFHGTTIKSIFLLNKSCVAFPYRPQ